MITFDAAIANAYRAMKMTAKPVHRGKWQGSDVSKRPEMLAYEICHYTMRVDMTTESLQDYRRSIKPNLPWADDHFMERVCGEPINPAVEWRNWPWATSAEKFLDAEGQFDHNYMERYWTPAFRGIRFAAGNLEDVVEELHQDPTTRQAILPVFFPEDTGYRPGRRKPCSLHYHFMLNQGKLDIQYVLRSCDLIRHYRDDIYMTIRLLLWMILQLRKRDATTWDTIKPGLFVMHIANLHCFANDRALLEEK